MNVREILTRLKFFAKKETKLNLKNPAKSGVGKVFGKFWSLRSGKSFCGNLLICFAVAAGVVNVAVVF